MMMLYPMVFRFVQAAEGARRTSDRRRAARSSLHQIPPGIHQPAATRCPRNMSQNRWWRFHQCHQSAPISAPNAGAAALDFLQHCQPVIAALERQVADECAPHVCALVRRQRAYGGEVLTRMLRFETLNFVTVHVSRLWYPRPTGQAFSAPWLLFSFPLLRRQRHILQRRLRSFACQTARCRG